jgi:hypothetical protein
MAKKRSTQEHEQLLQTVQMFEVIAETQPHDVQSLEILKEAYLNLERDADAVSVSKKIAQAYVHSGHLSSAILEYEGILQKFPDDATSLAALGELEAKMSGLAGRASSVEEKSAAANVAPALSPSASYEDGNEALARFFREHQLLSEKDCGNILSGIAAQISQTPSGRPHPSLLALISERGIASTEKSLALIAEKTRIPYVPINCYDVDLNKTEIIDKDFCLKHLLLPFDKISQTLMVATVNPFDSEAKAHVEFEAKSRVQWYITQPIDLVVQLKTIFHITS